MQNKFPVVVLGLFTFIVTMMVTSCQKENRHPGTPTTPHVEMEYFDLNNKEIMGNMPAFSFDVNHDGRRDLSFTTLLVGDPVRGVDKLQFLILSNIEVNLPVNGSEEIPVMNKGESIVPGNFNGYQWFELSSILLVQKIISFNMPPVWEGHWKNAVHKYLPYQLVVNGQRFNGWVELSVDIAREKIILHKAAISKEPNKIVKAGD